MVPQPLNYMKIIKNDLSVSQNFLVNLSFVESLVNKTKINKNDTVVEIGSGKGIISEILSKKAKEVVCIEHDPLLVSYLANKFKDNKNIKVVENNFLNYKLPTKPYIVFANPPFNISADIINKLLKLPNNMEEAYLILQRETLERFMGGPKYPNNQISILYKPFYNISSIETISRKEFNPSPNVDIVYSKFEKRKFPLIDILNYQIFRDFVIYGYNQWKPTLTESVSKLFTKDQLKLISKKIKISGLKPSELSIEQWLGLFDSFLNFVSEEKKILTKGFELKQSIKQKDMQKSHRTIL